MYASTIVALFAVAVVARPQAASSLLPRDFMSTMTFREAQDLCGSNMEVSCCNKDDNTSSQNSKENDGPLSKLLPDANVLGGECLKLDLIPSTHNMSPHTNPADPRVVIGDLLNKQCSGTVSCCDKSSSSSVSPTGGLSVTRILTWIRTTISSASTSPASPSRICFKPPSAGKPSRQAERKLRGTSRNTTRGVPGKPDIIDIIETGSNVVVWYWWTMALNIPLCVSVFCHRGQ